MVPAMMNKPPAKRALEALEAPAPIVPADAPKRISKKVRAAIDLMVNGDVKTQKEAAEKVGLARESLSRALSTPHVANHLLMKTKRRLGIAAARAGHTQIELLDSDSEIVRDRSSARILALAGIAPAAEPSINLNIEVKAGYVIDLSDDPRPAGAMRVVSPIPGRLIDHNADAE